MIQVIAFDLDDTLYPEKTFVKSGFRAVSSYIEKKFGIKKEQCFKELYDILKRQRRGRIFNEFLRSRGIFRKTLIKELVRTYRRHRPVITPYADTRRVLVTLGKRYKFAVITDGMANIQEGKIKALGISRYFDLIVYTDKYGKNKAKPNPHAFKVVMRHFAISPEEIIYVGNDPKKDFIGAKGLGIRTVRVKRGALKNISSGRRYDADYSISRLRELPKLVSHMNSMKNE